MTEHIAEYAIPSDSMDVVAIHLARAFRLAFASHDSGYKGPYLLHGDTHCPHISIYLNKDPMWRSGDPEDEQWFKPEYRSHGVLVEVWRTAAEVDSIAQSLRHLFPGTVELSREPLPA